MENLRKLREEFGLTQKELAEKMNVAKATVYFYEQNKVSPSTEMLIKLADYFNCSVDYLLGHQTKNTVYLDSLTENQKEAISLIKTLSDRETAKVIGYIERIKETPLEDIILKHLESEE